MSNTVSIEIDMVADEGKTAEETIALLEKESPGVTGEVIKRHGPGGGNPYVRWSGDLRVLESFLRGVYDFDDEEVDHWLVSPKGL